MPHVHLAVGSTLLPDRDALLLVSPDERFAAITGSTVELTDVAAVLRGRLPIPATGLAADIAAAAVDFGTATSATSAPRRRGPGRLRRQLDVAELQRVVRDHLAIDAVPVITEVLDDTTLQDRDTRTGQPWLPVHRELGALVGGPVLANPASPMTWADVRFRRMAASPARPQLTTLWRAWSSQGTRFDVEPDEAVIADGVRRLLAAVAQQGDQLLDHQLVVPLDGEREPTTHPVLPVPAGLLERMPA